MNVLQDIDEAQSMLSSKGSGSSGKAKSKGAKAAAVPTVPHPTNVNYDLLKADLKLVPSKSQEYKTIK